jgi:hypothetical protein
VRRSRTNSPNLLANSYLARRSETCQCWRPPTRTLSRLGSKRRDQKTLVILTEEILVCPTYNCLLAHWDGRLLVYGA